MRIWWRSALLWVGLMLAGSIVWCWHDSLTMESSAFWDGKRRLVQVRSADSLVEVYLAEGAGSGSGAFRYELDEEWEKADLLRKPYWDRVSIDGPVAYHVGVPYWIVLGVAVGVWGAVGGWRWRRWRKFSGGEEVAGGG